MENKYIPLYRKYRPQTFHDLIGQENIVHALSNAIKLNRISHAYAGQEEQEKHHQQEYLPNH